MPFRLIANMFITFGIFWLADKFFHNYVQIEDITTMIIATLFVFVIGWIFGKATVFLMMTGIGCLAFPVIYLIAWFLVPIKLILLDHYLPGFNINGFWAYVILSFLLYVLTWKKKVKKKEN